MSVKIPQTYLSRIWRAVIEFDMIDVNDKILIGLSGGKDSMFLAYGLSMIKKHSPRPFTLAAITIDPMFNQDFPVQKIQAFCQELDLDFYSERVDIAGIIENQQGKDPCFSCSYFRRGAINSFAQKNGFHKIALAHHHDDAVETFFMSLLCSGQLKTFLPSTYLSRTDLTVIRPLIYFREEEIISITKLLQHHPIKSPCPLDGHTKRQDIKELIVTLGQTQPALYDHLAAAMRSNIIDLWPKAPAREHLKEKFDRFWSKK